MKEDKREDSATPAQTQRLASLGFILASVCHEVSNPLAAVSSMLQILQSRRGVTPEINAIGTVVLLTSLGLLLIAQALLRVRDHVV